MHAGRMSAQHVQDGGPLEYIAARRIDEEIDSIDTAEPIELLAELNGGDAVTLRCVDLRVEV